MAQGMRDFRLNFGFPKNEGEMYRKPGFVHILSTFFLNVDKK